MSSLPPTNDDHWAPCPQGAIQAVVQAERNEITRRQVLRSAGAVAGVGILGFVAWQVQNSSPPSSALLVCADVEKLLPQYIHHTLSVELLTKVQNHLDSCQHCSARLQALQKVTI